MLSSNVWLSLLRSSSLASLLVCQAMTSPVSLPPDPLSSIQPTPISITPSFVADAVGNTQTAINSADGNRVWAPVVGGPTCWFCPRDDQSGEVKGGWALLGIKSPGVYRPISGTSFIAPLPLITVSPDGVPLYSSSGPTDELPTNAKRDEPEVEYIWTDQAKFIQPLLFKRGFMGEGSIANGIGYAIKIKTTTPKIFGLVNWPDHYGLVAGYISTSSKMERNSCGEIINEITVDYKAQMFHLALRENGEIYARFEKEEREFWNLKIADNEKELLPKRVKPLSLVEIRTRADGVAVSMRGTGYQYLSNNCLTFVNRLYGLIT